MMVSGGNAILVVCIVMVIYGCLKGRSLLASLSSCGMDGCELKRLYSEFKRDVVRLRHDTRVNEISDEPLDQATLEFMLDQSPPEDHRMLH